ncbi:Pentapeptide repeat-containing protein [Abditibacterium utsteinense]|uniref:Pentapeptide repeat-containing protein n=1 Tax=Abditibacterium utsteinense TaxID=1960156 RepID=A0A2S8SWH0_9BACT|nr:pentapeptide repeat-containing protein [Abditibacterium utsteinense]PQV65143.1 Pentapeptide repeat-containing protein [Abditibacterium utsteinense]
MPFVLAQRAQNRDASQRLTRALELLGEADLTQRLAGIYALEGLGRETGQEALQGAIIEVFSAFVRRRARWEIGFAPIETTPTDVLAALSALGRAPQQGFSADKPLDLHGIALREAVLPFCCFERAFLYDCDFEGALLVGAKLRGAWLARANLTRANLDGADLRGADLTEARGLKPENLKGVLHDADTRWP